MYNPELLDKPRVISLSKSDLVDDELKELINKDLVNAPFKDYLFFSAVTGQGVTELKDRLWAAINQEIE